LIFLAAVKKLQICNTSNPNDFIIKPLPFFDCKIKENGVYWLKPNILKCKLME
jgi:hypothetical protein